MKTRFIKFTFSLAAFGFVLQAQGQGTFQNLDFESANLPYPNSPQPPTAVSFADAFPGWIGYAGINQLTTSFNNGVSGGSALVTLITPNTVSLSLSNYVISGHYTAVLATGVNGIDPVPPFISAAIAQTGLIPLGTQSLRFSVGSLSAVSDLRLTLNGQNIPIFPLSAGSNYQVYGGDISAFAGLTEELRFTELAISFPFVFAYLDDIEFSSQAIPEPGVFGLFVFGALLLGWRLLRKRTL